MGRLLASIQRFCGRALSEEYLIARAAQHCVRAKMSEQNVEVRSMRMSQHQAQGHDVGSARPSCRNPRRIGVLGIHR